jgi:hypothetical protein
MFAGLKRRTYTVRYPRWMVGKPLLYSSSALAALGDAMFGYNQGIHRCCAGSTFIYLEDVWEGYDVGAGTNGPGRGGCVYARYILLSLFTVWQD